MCILFWTVDNHPKYKFIFAGNRDEFLRRPTARAKFWESNENILAGVDLESHPMETIKDGTWLGLTRQGRFAALTNYRETKFIGAMSRGVLVKDFLCGSDSVTTTLEHIKEHQDDYGGFSLICFDFGKQETDMAYLTNRENQPLFQLNPKEIYGLSNSTLDNPWPKVTKGREMFQNIVQTYDEKQMIESLFDMLKTGEHLQRTDDVPSILADLRERIFIPKFDFSSNTRLKEPSYATRTSTIVLIDNDGNATFVERDWYNDDFLPLKPGEYDDRLFKFQLQSNK